MDKRVIFGVLFILVIFISVGFVSAGFLDDLLGRDANVADEDVQLATPQYNCQETDGGNNPNVKGTTTLLIDGTVVVTRADICVSNTRVQEWNCAQGGFGYSIVHHTCSDECSNGACVTDDACTPQCSGKECGSNGCGGTCGTCGTGQSCNSQGQCVPDNGSVNQLRMTLSTQKGRYAAGEDIDLTSSAATTSVGSAVRFSPPFDEGIDLSPGGEFDLRYNIENFDFNSDGKFDEFELGQFEAGITGEDESLIAESFSALEYDGYIVEFVSNDPPTLVKEAELRETARKNQEIINTANPLSPQRLFVQAFGTKSENVESRILSYERDFKVNHDRMRGQVLDRLGRYNKEVGLSPPVQEVITNEFTGIFNGIALNIDKEAASDLSELPGVKVTPNFKVEAFLMDSVEAIHADAAHASGFTGKGVKIAIIDTGVDWTHSDLGSCVNFGPNCKVAIARNYVGGLPGGIPAPDKPEDDHGHGTHVAGIAAGNGPNLKGIAPDATIYSYKVFNNMGFGNSIGIIAGIQQAVADGADIISMSFGIRCYSSYGCSPDEPLSLVVDNAVKAGVVAVAAAGNAGPYRFSIISPGTAKNAITVGATYKKDYDSLLFRSFSGGDLNPRKNQVVVFSSRGPVYLKNDLSLSVKPDVVAPGAVICAAQWENFQQPPSMPEFGSCLGDGEHINLAGTSMATPHVAGAVALVLEAHPDWTPQQIKAALKQTATDLGYEPYVQGAGLVNVEKAAKLNSAPVEVEIYLKEVAVEVLDVSGTIAGGSVSSYKLEYGLGLNPSSWTQLASGTGVINKKLLADNFNAKGFPENTYVRFRLTATQPNGQTSKADITSCNADCGATPQPPQPPTPITECNDKIDNDGDGRIDLADVGCTSVSDNDESNCGDGVCEGGENANSCNADCGATPQPPRPASKIVNTGTSPVTGNLMMSVQRSNNGVWSDESVVANRQITVPGSGEFSLSNEWNSKSVMSSAVGDKRAYATFVGSDGSLQSSWAFNVGSSTCVPQCSGRVCGPNGCGGTCGTCGTGQSCNSQGQCSGGGSGQCVDSDRGINPNVRGTVTWRGSTSTDECIGSTRVREYFCRFDTLGIITLSCQSGRSCSNGACV